MSEKLLLPRDENSTNHPAPSQMLVGELFVNSVTGTLYSKLTDGTIVHWPSQKVCYAAVPKINFSDISTFCCYGDILTVSVLGLLPSPKNYTFECEELTGNGSTISISTTSYSPYIDSENPSISLRQAVVPVNITIANPQNINIFKFSLYMDNALVTEKTLAITCQVCGN
jgi:hypothetical protein